MIITRLKHGLGNQLFQYAIGRHLSLIKNTELKLDISHYDTDKSRNFELPFFSIPSLETNLEVHQEEEFSFYVEPHFHYDRKFRFVPKSTFIDGFWQSEKYFSVIRDTLVNDLQIRKELIHSVSEKAAELSNEDSVAIHIRRGDYLKSNFAFLGALPPGYYVQAIEIMIKKIPRAKLYFFSDDIDWVRKSIVIKTEHEFISGYITMNSIEDFHLIRHCRHHIIANSTFSWWAAWLSSYENKMVIGPAQWFHNAPHDTKDVLPKRWLKI